MSRVLFKKKNLPLFVKIIKNIILLSIMIYRYNNISTFGGAYKSPPISILTPPQFNPAFNPFFDIYLYQKHYDSIFNY